MKKQILKKTCSVAACFLLVTFIGISSTQSQTPDTESDLQQMYSLGICGVWNPKTGTETHGAGCIYPDPNGQCIRYSECVAVPEFIPGDPDTL